MRIQTRQREALSDKRILVAMDSWPATSRYPVGHYVKTLGPVGDKNIETEVRQDTATSLIEHKLGQGTSDSRFYSFP